MINQLWNLLVARVKRTITPEEVVMYEGVANSWREIAEGLKKENQELKQTKATVTEKLVKYKAELETLQDTYEALKEDYKKLKDEVDNLKL